MTKYCKNGAFWQQDEKFRGRNEATILSRLQLVLAVAVLMTITEVVAVDALHQAGCGVAFLVLAAPDDGGRGKFKRGFVASIASLYCQYEKDNSTQLRRTSFIRYCPDCWQHWPFYALRAGPLGPDTKGKATLAAPAAGAGALAALTFGTGGRGWPGWSANRLNAAIGELG